MYMYISSYLHMHICIWDVVGVTKELGIDTWKAFTPDLSAAAFSWALATPDVS